MAEGIVNDPPVLVGFDHTDEDNESNHSFDAENTQDLSRMETDLKEHMSQIALQMKNSMTEMTSHMQQRFRDVDRHLEKIDSQVHDNIRNIESRDRVTSLSGANENGNNMQQFSTTATAVNTTSSSNLSGQSNVSGQRPIFETNLGRGDNSVKLKPQSFSGTPGDDFEDYLAQFNITAEINGWNYRQKSLYLANSLTGNARSLLSELNEIQRKDYTCLVQKLSARYGFENRAEVFRAQLKSRVKGKTESISELSQAIKKLSRQSYPNASLDVIEALALDHFIDALTESDIRLRIREVGPKSLSEAEAMAIRLEAHRIADRQRTRLVGKIEQEGSDGEQKRVQNQMSSINKNVDHLHRRVEDLYKDKNPSTHNTRNRNSHNYSNRQHNNNSDNFRRPANAPRNNNFQRQNNFRRDQYRGDNPNNHYQSNQQFYGNHSHSGNGLQSNQGPRFRLN